MSKNLNRGEFNEDEFQALDIYGLKKGKVARLVHDTKKQQKKGIKASDIPVSYEELSHSELLLKAQQMGIPASAKMGKKELIQALKDHI
jgi:hypothetical protein